LQELNRSPWFCEAYVVFSLSTIDAAKTERLVISSRIWGGFLEPYTYTAAILIDELNACGFERTLKFQQCFAIGICTVLIAADCVRSDRSFSGQISNAPPERGASHLNLNTTNHLLVEEVFL